MTRRWLIGIPVALVAAFALGRYTVHPATRDVVKVETQWKDRIVEKIVHDVAVQHDTDEKVHTVVVTKWLKSPTGDVSVVQESRQERDMATETKRQDHTQGTLERQSEAHQATVETHTTESRPNWSVSVLAGVQDGGKRLVDALPAPAVVGVVVERRILGPVSAGLWATSGMAGGLSVRVDW